jgi:hypothetical protein
MKIWQKGDINYDPLVLAVEKFTVGNDKLWDVRLGRQRVRR